MLYFPIDSSCEFVTIDFLFALAEHDHHARILRGRHGRTQDPQRDEEDRVQEGQGARGQDERPVHVLQRARRRQGEFRYSTVKCFMNDQWSDIRLHYIIPFVSCRLCFSGNYATNILLRATTRDAGARGGAQDGVLEGEDQTGLSFMVELFVIMQLYLNLIYVTSSY